MANDEHVAILKKGVAAWNAWRKENPNIRPDLYEADLPRANLHGANLFRANLFGADLRGADLSKANLNGVNLNGLANLSGANLSNAELQNAQLDSAILRKANFQNADLRHASLMGAKLQGAILCGANLRFTNLIQANFSKADLTGSQVFGTSAWDLKLKGTTQRDLVVTEFGQSRITVDNIEVAQFMHLLLTNQKIRDVIDTIGKKGVLLLGRFEGRIAILERLRETLRDLGYVPMVFNFDKPKTKDFTETVQLLAGLSKFVIVDITAPKSVPL